MKLRLFGSVSLALVVLAYVAASAQAGVVYSEGFEGGAPTYAAGSFGAQWGLTPPGIVASNANATAPEGNNYAGFNTNNAATGVAIVGRMRSTVETVAAAGVTYTFTGEFAWLFDTLGNTSADPGIADMFLFETNTGFGFAGEGLTIPGGNLATQGGNYFFNSTESTVALGGVGGWTTVTYSYTTIAGDVGKTLEAWIEVRDLGLQASQNQLLADNFVVTSVPEPTSLSLMALVGLTLGGLRRRKV